MDHNTVLLATRIIMILYRGLCLHTDRNCLYRFITDLKPMFTCQRRRSAVTLRSWYRSWHLTVHWCLLYQAPKLAYLCTSPTADASLRSYRPPSSPFGQPSQTEYYTVSSQHIWHHPGFLNRRPTVWNSLPDSLRDPTVEYERFRRDLKTHLFAVGHERNRTIQIDTYLLTYLLTTATNYMTCCTLLFIFGI